MKKIIILLVCGFLAIIVLDSFNVRFKEPIPPTGYTGAPTPARYCTNCHGDFALNPAGGSVTATGLPTGSYGAGQVYNFSITITNATPMAMWGFTIKAVIGGSATASTLGTFSTTNPNTTVVSGELKNNGAVLVTGTSYTYTGLKWTAPASGTSSVSFHMSGIAADNSGDETGDYCYNSSILSVPIPVTLGDINGRLTDNGALIEWSTYTEVASRSFDIERSVDGLTYQTIQSVASAGNSNSVKKYSYQDLHLPSTASVLYYRLKMVDMNGKFEYSRILSLKPALTTYIDNVFPTLLSKNDWLHVSIVSNKVQEATISIINSAGVKVATQVQPLVKGQNNFMLNGLRMANTGIYVVNIKAGNFTESRKVAVQ